jgi:hypothetical protein
MSVFAPVWILSGPCVGKQDTRCYLVKGDWQLYSFLRGMLSVIGIACVPAVMAMLSHCELSCAMQCCRLGRCRLSCGICQREDAASANSDTSPF